jgi:hypothetical protein
VRYWPLDEGSGTIVKDSSGNGDTGTWTTPCWTAGKIGSFAGCSTGNNVINFSTNTNLPTSAITASAWVNVTAHANFPNYINNSWTAQEGSWLLYSDSSGHAMFGVYHASSQYVALGCSSQFTTLAWHLLTGTYDGSTVRVYLDGVLCNTTALSGEILFNSGNLWFTDVAGNNISFDDARVYNRALPAAEIQAMYNAEK